MWLVYGGQDFLWFSLDCSAGLIIFFLCLWRGAGKSRARFHVVFLFVAVFLFHVILIMPFVRAPSLASPCARAQPGSGVVCVCVVRSVSLDVV